MIVKRYDLLPTQCLIYCASCCNLNEPFFAADLFDLTAMTSGMMQKTELQIEGNTSQLGMLIIVSINEKASDAKGPKQRKASTELKLLLLCSTLYLPSKLHVQNR